MLKPIDTSTWSSQDIIREAKMQTDAIARLDVWKRLAYSLVAIGFVLGLWGANVANTIGIAAGVLCLVAGIPASVVLTVGVSRGRNNVKHMLEAAGVDVGALLRPRSKGEAASSRSVDNTPAAKSQNK